MLVINRKVVDIMIKEFKELSHDSDIGRSATQSTVEEVNTPHVCGLHRFCVQRVNTCTHVLYQIQCVPVMCIHSLTLNVEVQKQCNVC